MKLSISAQISALQSPVKSTLKKTSLIFAGLHERAILPEATATAGGVKDWRLDWTGLYNQKKRKFESEL